MSRKTAETASNTLIILSRHFYVSVAHIIAEINNDTAALASFSYQPNFIYISRQTFGSYAELTAHILSCNSNPQFLREDSLSCLANLHDGPRRSPPRNVFRHVQRKLDGDNYLFDDSGKSHEFPHHRVGKPKQNIPPVFTHSLEYNECNIPPRLPTADAISLEKDRILDRCQAILQSVKKTVNSVNTPAKICLGKLSIFSGQKFCQWCFTRHNIRATQDSPVEYCEDLFAVFIPANLPAKVIRSIRAKFRRM